LDCYAATQLTIQLHQERIQVVRSNREAQKRPAELNGTPAMDLGFEDTRKRRYTNKQGIEQKTFGFWFRVITEHFFFGLESTQLACRVQKKRAQVEAQYWGEPEVARLEGTPAILF